MSAKAKREYPAEIERALDRLGVLRGWDLGMGLFLSTCEKCRGPIAVSRARIAKLDMRCERCAIHKPSMEMATAFSAEKGRGGA